MRGEAAIVVDDLSRAFVTGPRRRRSVVEAVRNLSFVVEPGERLAFIGPNGAGKSTSIKMLTDLLHARPVPLHHRGDVDRAVK